MTNPFIDTFFSQHGARIVDGQIVFAETAADIDRLTQQTTVSVMMYHALVTLQSADNLKFLQGQFTCDVREVTREQWRYGALCTHQGRMIANFLMLQTADNIHTLRLSTGTVDALASTLAKFAPFYKASVADHSHDAVLLGICGSQAPALVTQVFAQAPAPGSALHHEQAIVIALDEQRFECWVKNEYLASIWPQLAAGATPTGCAFWQLMNIRAGLGEVRAATVEKWTPHMLNLQVTGAISFKKGCYTGQEIVARTEYRGHQKRAMYRVQGSGVVPEAGTPVLDGEHAAGEIVMASCSDSTHWEALAVLTETVLDHALVCQQQPVQLLTLPYTVTTR